MQLVDWLNDLTVRFLINLPPSELTSVSRICFQIEEAQWYYEDFVRPLEAASGNHLPHLPLKDFCLLMFKTCPLTSGFTEAQHVAAYDTFLAYKTRIPVRGAIMLDQSMERAVLVKGWKKGASWSFPRGKINKDEKDLHCAVREVYEETGYDIKAAGLVPKNEEDAKYIDVNIREQQVRLFVFSGVPPETHFEPRTRKEISGIQWYNLRDLPGFSKPKKGTDAETVAHHSRFYMVAPFIGPLKKWIGQQRRVQAAGAQVGYETSTALTDDAAIAESTNDARTQELRHLLNIGTVPVQPPVQPEVREVPREQYLAHGQQMQQTLLAHDPRQYQGMPPQYNIPPQQHFSQHHGAPPQMQHQQAWPEQVRSPPQHVALPPVQNMLLQQFNGPSFSQGFPQQPALHNGMLHHLAGQQTVAPQEEPRELRAAPKASELPAPKLNAHAMRLLETFKTSSNPQDKSKANPAQASTHQTRLLDLFKSPTPDAAKTNAAPPEIPIASKPAPVAVSRAQPPTAPQAVPTTAAGAPAPPSIHVSVKPAPQARAAKEPKQKDQARNPIQSAEYGFMQEMQALTARKPAPSPQPRQNAHSPANTVRRHKHKNSQEAPKVPSFTILPRPGSAKEDAVDFKPQILKRPSQDLLASPATPANGNTPQQDHLLALFGKGRAASTATPPTQVVEPPNVNSPPAQPGQNVTLLQHRSPAQTTPLAPQAPRIVPEVRAPPTTTQSNLLDLFKKPGLVTSPETPISPFALGSPQAIQHAPLRGLASSPLDKRTEVAAERKGSSSATPTEAKGFLLGFLNNVVQKEGRST